ncbi:MAG: hypothetical protein DHS20C11_26230 [Lysobacteraceae bacterium]|nr:MAG: hypothetical protein DHS20C11_26230 [Xanthomonadaceae bacterium]
MKTLLTTAITAVLATSTVYASDSNESDEQQASEQQKTYMGKRLREGETRSPAYGEDDPFDLAVEPCPDKFDKAWSKTNDADEPCLNTRTEQLQMPDGSDVVVNRDQRSDERTTQRDDSPALQVRPGQASPLPADADELVCKEEDFSHQAVADNRYRDVLDQRENRDKPELGTFNPDAEVAKSVQQLTNADIEPEHIDATFAALDDNGSGAVDKIESLDVRGLADVFDQADLNEDEVISSAEFALYFDGELDGAYCLDGERITSLDEVDDDSSSS